MLAKLGFCIRAKAMWAAVVRLFLSLSLLGIASGSSNAEMRVALVIGNSTYAHAGRLANPKNDAADVAAVLTRVGFEVTPVYDTAGADFARAVDGFLGRARGADVAIFYYAGHGLQYEGAPYLLPVDARLENEFSIKRETLAAQDIVTALEGSAHASIVVLDACRNNPLAEQLRQKLAGRGRAAALSRGLGRIEAASGNTLVVYSAGPGQEAQDGENSRNSPFTAAFLRHAETPGLEVEQMLKRVTADVEKATNGAQQPERLSRLKIELWLKGQGAARPEDPAQAPMSEAATAWSEVKDVRNIEVLEAFRKQYGASNPLYDTLAARRLVELREQAEKLKAPLLFMTTPGQEPNPTIKAKPSGKVTASGRPILEFGQEEQNEPESTTLPVTTHIYNSPGNAKPSGRFTRMGRPILEF
jgi:uncharacterized caspase-like protein